MNQMRRHSKRQSIQFPDHGTSIPRKRQSIQFSDPGASIPRSNNQYNSRIPEPPSREATINTILGSRNLHPAKQQSIQFSDPGTS